MQFSPLTDGVRAHSFVPSDARKRVIQCSATDLTVSQKAEVSAGSQTRPAMLRARSHYEPRSKSTCAPQTVASYMHGTNSLGLNVSSDADSTSEARLLNPSMSFGANAPAYGQQSQHYSAHVSYPGYPTSGCQHWSTTPSCSEHNIQHSYRGHLAGPMHMPSSPAHPNCTSTSLATQMPLTYTTSGASKAQVAHPIASCTSLGAVVAGGQLGTMPCQQATSRSQQQGCGRPCHQGHALSCQFGVVPFNKKEQEGVSPALCTAYPQHAWQPQHPGSLQLACQGVRPKCHQAGWPPYPQMTAQPCQQSAMPLRHTALPPSPVKPGRSSQAASSQAVVAGAFPHANQQRQASPPARVGSQISSSRALGAASPLAPPNAFAQFGSVAPFKQRSSQPAPVGRRGHLQF